MADYRSRCPRKTKIDVVFQGEGEQDLVDIFKKLMNNENVPKSFEAKKSEEKKCL